MFSSAVDVVNSPRFAHAGSNQNRCYASASWSAEPQETLLGSPEPQENLRTVRSHPLWSQWEVQSLMPWGAGHRDRGFARAGLDVTGLAPSWSELRLHSVLLVSITPQCPLHWLSPRSVLSVGSHPMSPLGRLSVSQSCPASTALDRQTRSCHITRKDLRSAGDPLAGRTTACCVPA